MNQIDDPRLLFYLKHQALIEEWAAVKDDVRHAAIEFYESLADDLEVEAETLGDDVVVVRWDAGYGYVGLAKRSWLCEDTARVAIALEWQRSSASFTSGIRFAGVRVDLDAQGGGDLSSAIRDRVRAKRESTEFRSSSQWWPAYAAVPGPEDPEYWKNLQSFRGRLIGWVVDAWNTFSDDVQLAVNTTPISND